MRRFVVLLGAMPLAVLLAFGGAASTQDVPQQPNILFILTDDQEASTLAHMDTVQRELVSQGKTFENAVFTFPLCCPSRASIQSGLYPHNHGVLRNAGRGGFSTFKKGGHAEDTVAAWVDAAGYQTGYFGSYMPGTPRGLRVPGWDEMHTWTKKSLTGAQKQRYLNRVDTKTYNNATEFLEGTGEEPFFAFVAFLAPHAPYRHPARYNGMFTDAQAPRTPDMNEADVSDKPRYVRSQKPKDMGEIDSKYRAALRSLELVDEFVGQSATILRAKGEWDNTYVVFYTDNGTHLGYHRLGYGKRTPYDPDINFPLLVRGPGVAQGAESDALIGNHDIAPTLAEFGGAVVPESVDGRSFAGFVYGEPPATWRDAILMQGLPTRTGPMPRWYGVRTTRYTYVEYATGEKELYDLWVDPYELENLAGTMPELEAELAVRMEALKGCVAQGCREAEN